MNQGKPQCQYYNQPQNVERRENSHNVNVPFQNQTRQNVNDKSQLPDQQNKKVFKQNPRLKMKQKTGGMQNHIITDTLYTIAQTRNQEDTNKNSTTRIDLVVASQFIKQTHLQQKQQNTQINAYVPARNLSTHSSKQQLLKLQSIQSSNQLLRQNEGMKNVFIGNGYTPGIISEDTQNIMLSSANNMKQSMPPGQVKSYGPNKVLGPTCQFCHQQAEINENKVYGQAFMGWTILLCLTSPCLVWIPYCYEPCYDRELRCIKCRRIRNVLKSKWGCGY